MEMFKEKAKQEIDARRLPWLVEQYLAAVKGKVARRTHQHYANKLRWFLLWSEKYETITVENMGEFRDFLAATSLKKMTQRGTIGRVAQVFRWAVAAGLAEMDYSLWLPVIRAPRPTFVAPTILGVQKLLDAAGYQRHAPRNQAFIALLAATGLRLAEATALNTDDISFFADGTGGRVIVKSGKNSKSRTVIFSRRWADYIRKWCKLLGPNQPMFPGHGDTHWGAVNQDSLYGQFKAAAKLAHLKFTCHDMRRHYATQWVQDHPGRFPELQRQLGHSDPGATAIYVWISAADIRELVKSEWPATIDSE